MLFMVQVRVLSKSGWCFGSLSCWKIHFCHLNNFFSDSCRSWVDAISEHQLTNSTGGETAPASSGLYRTFSTVWLDFFFSWLFPHEPWASDPPKLHLDSPENKTVLQKLLSVHFLLCKCFSFALRLMNGLRCIILPHAHWSGFGYFVHYAVSCNSHQCLFWCEIFSKRSLSLLDRFCNYKQLVLRTYGDQLVQVHMDSFRMDGWMDEK